MCLSFRSVYSRCSNVLLASRHSVYCVHSVHKWHPIRASSILPQNRIMTDELVFCLVLCSAQKWKQSYSILDIFRELSSAFESTNSNDMENVDAAEISGAIERLRSFKCMWTGHRSDNPVPKRGQPIPHSRKQIDQLRASQPLTIENHDYQWRYCRIKQIECSFGKVYYEARVIQSILGESPYSLSVVSPPPSLSSSLHSC